MTNLLVLLPFDLYCTSGFWPAGTQSCIYFYTRAFRSPVPASSSVAVTSWNQRHGQTPKQQHTTTTDNHPDRTTDRQTHTHPHRHPPTNNNNTDAHRQTNRNRKRKPRNAAHTPYSRSLEGQTKCNAMASLMDFWCFFFYTRAFRSPSLFGFGILSSLM